MEGRFLLLDVRWFTRHETSGFTNIIQVQGKSMVYKI
jgi:hypothetical protein